MIEALKRWWKELFRVKRRCASCNEWLELNTEWEKEYRRYCSKGGWKPEIYKS